MKKRLKWTALVLIAGFALLQLANPALTNPPVINDVLAGNPPPPQIAERLHATCYDCHSYETKWPWYAHVAPMSWLIASDVNGGREHLNLSDWPKDSERAAKKLERMSEAIEDKDMPMPKYTLIHAEARLTDDQRKELMKWLDATAEQLKSAAPAK